MVLDDGAFNSMRSIVLIPFVSTTIHLQIKNTRKPFRNKLTVDLLPIEREFIEPVYVLGHCKTLLRPINFLTIPLWNARLQGVWNLLFSQ